MSIRFKVGILAGLLVAGIGLIFIKEGTGCGVVLTTMSAIGLFRMATDR